MQTTSALYKQIVSSDDHFFETKIAINGNEIIESNIISVAVDRIGLAESKPSIGAALSATLKLTVIKPTFSIPRQAAVVVSVRAKNTSQVSEWIAAGTFYIDTRREVSVGKDIQTLEISAFDAMAKATADYPDTTHNWPYPAQSVVAEIASAIGVSVDSRTNAFLSANYPVDLPLGYTMRETLENIAASFGGNFIITAANKLLFVPLYGLDPEENLSGSYLAVEGGTDAVLFGGEGWYILV